MKKSHKWLIGIGISLVVLIGASITALYIGTDIVLKTLMPELEETEVSGSKNGVLDSEMNIEPEKETSGQAEAEPEAEPEAETGVERDETKDDPSADPSANGQSEQTGDADHAESVATNAELETPAPDIESESAPADPQSGPKQEQSDPLAYSAEISEEKQAAVRESITLRERLKLTTTLTKNLSGSEISHFMSLAQGGLTIEEKREAKKIMLEKLSEDEYNELIAIAAKYGLSQGKGYAE